MTTSIIYYNVIKQNNKLIIFYNNLADSIKLNLGKYLSKYIFPCWCNRP